MKLVIDRNKWLRGNPNTAQLLRIDNGKMCCLGFFALALGYTEDQISGLGDPIETIIDGPRPNLWPTWGVCRREKLIEHDQGDAHVREEYEDTDDFNQLMTVNDDAQRSERSREDRIRSIFARNGVEVKFV